MAGKKWFLIIVLLLLGLKSFGQSYQYTYIDPCTGVPNTVTISQPSGSVTLFYAGQYRTFTQVELQTGAYESWVASINAAAPPGSNPCAGNAGAVSSNTSSTVGTNVVTTVSTISSTLSTLGGSVTTNSGGMDFNGSSSGGGGGSSSDSGGDDNGSNTSSGSNDSGSSSGGSTGSGDTGGSSGGGSTGGGDTGGGSSGGSSGSGDTGGGSTGGGSTGGSSGSSGGSGSGGNSSGGNTEGNVGSDGGGVTTGDDDSGTSMGGAVGDKDIDTESGGQSSDSDDSGGSGGGKKKKGPRARKGSLIASGDMVLIRNGSDYKAKGMDNFKLNLGMTYANTEQTLTAGTLLNYTTGQNEIALTVYGSWKVEESMIVGSDAFLYNIKQQTWFNTGNLMYAYKQTKYTTILFGTNYSIGRVGEENFQNWAGNMGVFSTFNGYKGVSMNGMMIAMYSPYTFFYEGQWLKGGFLFIPLTSVDFKVTDTFKLNVSTSTVYLMGQGILNFQVMTGGKMLL